MLFRGIVTSASLFGLALASTSNLCSNISACISSSSTIDCGGSPNRWSEYGQPAPGVIVKIGAEDDVAKVVTAANALNLKFLVQSGGNGWADTFTLGATGILIDISGLKSISFNSAKTEVTYQAGVTIQELVQAAWNNNARVATGTCNCVSALGAGLGGGVGRGTGLYGLGSDQLLKVNLVDASGKKVTVTAKSDPDLWWALGGAGANFGIVTSVVYKSYAVAQADNTAWAGMLIYDSSSLEALITAIDKLTLEPEMQLDFTFTQGSLIALPFYLGDEATGREKFASILSLALVDQTEVISYNEWNTAGDSFCTKGGRKPAFGANLKTLDPTAWRSAWDEYISFYSANTEAAMTTILVECYSNTKMQQIGSSASAYPWRDSKCYGIVIPWYTSSSLDSAATEFAGKIRNYWYNSAGTSSPSSYINFAHGDESLSTIYGSSLSKLKTLKKKYDPKGRFNEWFPITA